MNLSEICDNVENSDIENKAQEKIKWLISPVRKVYKKGKYNYSTVLSLAVNNTLNNSKGELWFSQKLCFIYIRERKLGPRVMGKGWHLTFHHKNSKDNV